MLVQRETFVSLFIATVAIVAVVGGFAAFSGLSVYDDVLQLNMHKVSFVNGDVFDVDVDLAPSTFLYDESMVVYVDGKMVSVISLKKYFDDTRVAYGEQEKQGIRIMTLKDPSAVNLADFVPLADLATGNHYLKVHLSQSDAVAEASFRIV